MPPVHTPNLFISDSHDSREHQDGVRGAIVGLAGALVLTRFMAGLLFGVRPTDLWTLGAVALLLGGIALAACCVPAVRAAKVDPMVALRYQ
jgi:putative ABC transport system permease protein